jgi:hypothetical protein
MKQHLIKLTGLWIKKDSKGNTYYKGNLGPNIKILILPNHLKNRETDPDLDLLLGQEEKKSPQGIKTPSNRLLLESEF